MLFARLFRVYLTSLCVAFSGVLTLADDVTTADGKTYKDYKIIAQDSKGITIVYIATQTLSFDDLPVDLQKKLGHDPAAVSALLAAKRAKEQALDAAYAQKENELNAQDKQLDLELASVKAKDAAAYAQSPKTTITGQIFIAPQGGESIRFDGVHVGLIPIDLINLWLPAKQKRVAAELQMLEPRVKAARSDDDEALLERDAAVGTDNFTDSLEKQTETRSALDKVLSRRDYFSTGEYYADALAPYYAVEAVTDLNGKFTISAPTGGEFVLAARVESRMESVTKTYYWFVKVRPATTTDTYILLDSENMSSSGTADSILHTDENADEAK